MEVIESDSNNKDETIRVKITCPKAEGLQSKLKSTIDEVLENVTKEFYVKAYKKCYQNFEKKEEINKPSLSGSSNEARAYRGQFNAIVRNNVFEVIDETVSTMDDQLKELEDLIKSQNDSKLVWRPPGDAYKHMIPFDSVSKLDEKNLLEDKIQKEEEVIQLLKTRLVQKRLKANQLHEKLKSKINTIADLVSNEQIDS